MPFQSTFEPFFVWELFVADMIKSKGRNLGFLNFKNYFQTTDWLIGSSSALLIILRLVENRQVILTMGVDKIILQQLSKPNQNFQLQYQLVCCLWFISFNHAPELAQNSTLIGTHRVLFCRVFYRLLKLKYQLYSIISTFVWI